MNEAAKYLCGNNNQLDRVVEVLVKLKFPANYTDEQISDIITECDYTFNYPVNEDDNEVHPIDSEIIEHKIK